MGRRALTTEEFIEKARSIHGDKYDYSKTDYKYSIDKVIITCKDHGDFMQTPNDHLKGSGCAKCGFLSSGWTHTKWIQVQGDHKLYIIICESLGEKFVKIGKTSRKIESRFTGKILPYSYESWLIVDTAKVSARELSELEVRLHKELRHLCYSPKTSFKGDTECFSMSCLWHPSIQELVQNYG